MPWDPKYRKPTVTGVSARAIDVVVEAGDSAPMTPIGINLPNDQAIREAYGSKSVSLSNIFEAYNKSTPASLREEFSWSPDEAARAERWGDFAAELSTNLHEIIGHGSGLVEPERRRGSQQPPARAVLDARGDARRSGGALLRRRSADGGARPGRGRAITATSCSPSTKATRATRSCSCAASAKARTLEEDHMRNRQAIVHWLMAHTTAIERRVARRQDLLRDGRRGRLPRRRRPDAGRGPAHQGAGGLRRGGGAVRGARHALRAGAARRGPGPHRRARSAGLHRLRAAASSSRCATRPAPSPTCASPIRATSPRRCCATPTATRRCLEPDGRWPWAPPPSDPPRPPTRIGRSTTCCGSGARCTPTATPRRRSSGRW